MDVPGDGRRANTPGPERTRDGPDRNTLELPPQPQCQDYNYPGESCDSEGDSEDKTANPADLTIDVRRTGTCNA